MLCEGTIYQGARLARDAAFVNHAARPSMKSNRRKRRRQVRIMDRKRAGISTRVHHSSYPTESEPVLAAPRALKLETRQHDQCATTARAHAGSTRRAASPSSRTNCSRGSRQRRSTDRGVTSAELGDTSRSR
eukprot:1572940-Pleurochrysis_carterae.AAC.3